MGSPNADTRLRKIEDDISVAKLHIQQCISRHSELGNAIREIQTQAARQVMELEEEYDLSLGMAIKWEKRVEELECELSKSRSVQF